MDKHYLIGAFSKGALAQTYLDSLAVVSDQVEPIFLQYLNKEGSFDSVSLPAHAKLIKVKKAYPGNTGKHKDFRELLSPLLVRDAWCLFTDMHDVVFQAPLPPFPDTQILLASEGKIFKDVPYWQEMFPDDVMSLEIYNVGCFAMKRDTLLAFWDELYAEWMQFHSWYKTAHIPRFGNGDNFPFNIPFHDHVRVEMAVMFNSHYDTLIYNRFIRKHRRTELPHLFGCYAYQVDQGIIEQYQNQLYRAGQLVSIAHYNGSTDTNLVRKEDHVISTSTDERRA